MKTALIFWNRSKLVQWLTFGLLLAAHCFGQDVIIDMSLTEERNVQYELNGQKKTPDQIDDWVRHFIKEFGATEKITLTPEKDVPFLAVFALLEHLKGAGATSFIIDSKLPEHIQKDRYMLLSSNDIVPIPPLPKDVQ